VNVGWEDVFIGRTGLTVSGEYQAAFASIAAYGADLRYYVRPLGNVAAVVGYRHLETNRSTDGVNLGARLLLVLSAAAQQIFL